MAMLVLVLVVSAAIWAAAVASEEAERMRAEAALLLGFLHQRPR